MSKVLVTESYLQDIADAIRAKNGSNDAYTPAEMAAAIGNISNSYTASDEGKVVSSGALVAQTSTTVTANGTYDTTENDEVVVNVEDVSDTYAFIVAEYDAGYTCTVTNGTITYSDASTTGKSVFPIPTPETVPEDWTVTLTDGETTLSKVVSVSEYGESYSANNLPITKSSYNRYNGTLENIGFNTYNITFENIVGTGGYVEYAAFDMGSNYDGVPKTITFTIDGNWMNYFAYGSYICAYGASSPAYADSGTKIKSAGTYTLATSSRYLCFSFGYVNDSATINCYIANLTVTT